MLQIRFLGSVHLPVLVWVLDGVWHSDPQPGTSQSCRAKDTGPVCQKVCLFTSQLNNSTKLYCLRATTCLRPYSMAQRLGF